MWVVVGAAAALVAFLVASSEYRKYFLFGGGIASGALIAAIVLGLVLTYRGSGVVNFANGAIAMYIAYLYAGLRRDGSFFLPPFPNPLVLAEGIVHVFQSEKTFVLRDIPSKISFGSALSFWPAFVISLGFSVLLGVLLHLLIFRPLRNVPPLAKVVASVGLLLYLQAVVIRRFNTTPRAVKPLPYLKSEQVNLGLTKINQAQLFVAVLVVLLAFALWFLFQRTRFGLATCAAAENEKGAVMLGFSPDFLVGANWVLSTLIAGMLGILVASVNSTIEPIVLPALIVPALTAALVGSFSSFGRTTLAAFVLGMQVPLILYLGTNKSWFPKSGSLPLPGVEYLLPVLVIVVVLYVAGNALPTRGAITAGRLPFSPTPPRWAIWYGGPVLVFVTLFVGLFVFGPGYRGALTNTLVGVIICLSVVVITGFVGQISLAEMTFAGVSAFLVSHLSSELGWPFPWPIFAGALAAAAFGLLVAVPALRVRGVNLAIVTFAFAVAVDRMIFANNSVNGGFNGAPVNTPQWINPYRPVRYHFLGLTLGDNKQPNPTTAIFCLIAALVLCYLVVNIRRSATGRRMLAVRSNERAVAAAGINVSGTKILAFAVSAFIAGIGGAVIAYRSGNVTADNFDYRQSLVFLAFAYLGGIASVSGAIVGGLLVAGGLVFYFLQSTLGVPTEFTLMLGGLALIVSAILNPEGIAGGLHNDGLKLLRRFGLAWAEHGGRSTGSRPAGKSRVMELLRTTHMSVTFGGLRAVDAVDLTVVEGRLVGLIGPNGAGKTTFIDAITGFVPTTGSIRFLGEEISHEPAHRRSRRGLAGTWQSLELFEDLDIGENLAVAAQTASIGGFLGDLTWPSRKFARFETLGRKNVRAKVDFALDVLGLRDLATRMPKEISQGQRKLVSVARALAARPRLLCMDEPAAGLDTSESQQLGSRLRDIVYVGITVLLVDHDMGLVLNVCDDIYVIEFGAVIAHGTPAEVKRDPRVVTAYLGSSAEGTPS